MIIFRAHKKEQEGAYLQKKERPKGTPLIVQISKP